MSPTELVAVFVSALSVWLTGCRVVWCWPVTLVACLLYGIVFHEARLYADMALQAVFAALACYGWWRWQSAEHHDGSVQVRPLEARSLWFGVVLSTACGAGAGYALSRLTDDAAPFSDAMLSAYSILGQVWMARQHIACWWVWIVVDLFYTGLFAVRGLYPTAVLYAVFVGLAVTGLRLWRKEAK